MNQIGANTSQTSSAESLFPGFPTLDIGRLLSVVKKRLWLAALVAGIFVALAVAYVLTATKIYASNAVIYIPQKNEGAVFDGIKGAKVASWESLDALKSMAEGIQNGAVILRVANKLKLRDDPDFIKPKEGGYTDAEIVDIISRRVYASLRRGTRIIDVMVKDKSPERAQQMTKAFIEEFQDLIREQNSVTAAKATRELETQAAAQLKRVMAAEDVLQKFREDHADMSLDETGDGTGVPEKKLEELNRLLSASVNEFIMRKSEYEQLQKIPDEQAEKILEIGKYSTQDHIQKLLTARSVAETKYHQAKAQFSDTHPNFLSAQSTLKSLNDQVNAAAIKIGRAIESSYAGAKGNKEQLKEAVQEQKLHLLKVSKLRKESTAHQREVDAAYGMYQSLLDRVNQTDVTSGIDETVIRVFGEPMVPSKPISPKKKVTVALAGVFGSFVGLALVIGIGLLDRTMHNRKQVESTLGLPVLAEIPRAFKKNWDLKESLIVTKEPFSLVSEGIRGLRTALSSHSPRSVLITSASPGEGKSFCSANLAVLQANMGYRTLLVDADFRKPKMAEIFTDPLFAGGADAALATQGHCQETIYENLYLISCGRFTANTGEPMSSEHFASMLWEAYSSFDCVIIDTSPVGAVSDGLSYSRHVDAVVMVVRAGQTEAGAARDAISELKRMRAPIVGCVLNDLVGLDKIRDAYVAESILKAHPASSPSPQGRPSSSEQPKPLAPTPG